MEALGKNTRYLLKMAKTGHEPPPTAKARMRERLDSKLAAAAIIGTTGLASKTTLAGVALPAGKTLLLSLVLVGAVGVGYATAPALRTPSATRTMPATQPLGERNVAGVSKAPPVEVQVPSPNTEVVVAAAPEAEVHKRNATVRATAFVAKPVESPQAIAAAETTARGEEPVSEVVPSTPPDAASADNRLADETQLIRKAHQAILLGNSAVALELVAEHQQRFPAGVLQQERDAARIVANCALGRTDEARRHWTRFTATWTNSPLTDRIRTSCHWTATE